MASHFMTMSSQAVARERHISSMSASARHSAAQAFVEGSDSVGRMSAPQWMNSSAL